KNGASIMVVPPDQVGDEVSLLSLLNICHFTDPGFDNPNNPQGEVTERFTFAVDWGDGTPLDSGAGTIDVPGGPGVLTQGHFSGSPVSDHNRIHTSACTNNDDDGGTTTATVPVTGNNSH